MFSSLLKNIDALLITNPLNIRYLTGFVGLAPEEREGYVLITSTSMYLFTNALYIEKAKQLVSQNFQSNSNSQNAKIEIVEISRENPLSGKLNEILQNIGSVYAKTINLGFEETNLTYAEYQKLNQELENITLSPTRNRIEELRKYKRPDEIENIRKAAKLTDDCFDFILKKIKAGVTETEIAWEIESYFKKNDAENAFPPIVAFGSNSSQPHYASGNAILGSPSQQSTKNQSLALNLNNIVLLDFGARVNGYCSDMTRVVFFGKPTEEQRKAYETVLAANEAALKILNASKEPLLTSPFVKGRNSPSLGKREFEGVPRFFSGATLDQAARDEIKKAGLPTYPHSLGHNLGLAIHERPRLSMKYDEELKPCMVFTIEPGVYLEGKFGIRIEDLVLLKEDKVEILSNSPKDIIIV